MAAASVAPIALELAKGAGQVYAGLDEKAKTGIWAGLTSLGFATGAVISIPVALISTIINVIILSIIFTITLYRKYAAQIRRGQVTMRNPAGQAIARGLGLALLAGVILFGASMATGGLASMAMLLVYPIAGLFTGIGTLINPGFLQDVAATSTEAGYISGFTRWSLAFWPVFLITMIISVVMTVGLNVASAGLAKRAADIATSVL